MLYTLAACIGAIIGVIVTKIIEVRRNPTVGRFVINTSNPEKEIFAVEFTRDPFEMTKHQSVTFLVVSEENEAHSE